MTFSEGGWAGRGQGNFWLLGREAILEGGWTTSWPTAWRYAKELEILPFPLKDLKLYMKKEEDKWKTLVMEHFNGILFHKSGPANKQHTNQQGTI